MGMNDIKVTVFCLTYNHVAYIETAVKSFLMQETNFDYEIVIHDDASTDGTTDILKKYQRLFPNKVVVVSEAENQYQNGEKNLLLTMKPYIRGKYVALCEGDDYWTDAKKLQRQVDFLDSHPEYSLCVHNSIIEDCQSGKTQIYRKTISDEIIPLQKIFLRNRRLFCTSSMVYRSSFFLRPDTFYIDKIGDYPLAVYLAMEGKIYYMNHVMSVYRRAAEGSYSFKAQEHEKAYIENLNCKLDDFYYRLDRDYNKRYSDLTEKARSVNECMWYLKVEKDIKKAFEIKAGIKYLPFKVKLYYSIEYFFPKLIAQCHRTRGKY